MARLWHIGGIIGTLAITVVIAWAALHYGFNQSLRGTWLTMRWVTGLVGLIGVAGVMTYPARKQIYRRRAGALRYWLLAHIYLGVMAGIVLLIHGGSHGGGPHLDAGQGGRSTQRPVCGRPTPQRVRL